MTVKTLRLNVEGDSGGAQAATASIGSSMSRAWDVVKTGAGQAEQAMVSAASAIGTVLGSSNRLTEAAVDFGKRALPPMNAFSHAAKTVTGDLLEGRDAMHAVLDGLSSLPGPIGAVASAWSKVKDAADAAAKAERDALRAVREQMSKDRQDDAERAHKAYIDQHNADAAALEAEATRWRLQQATWAGEDAVAKLHVMNEFHKASLKADEEGEKQVRELHKQQAAAHLALVEKTAKQAYDIGIFAARQLQRDVDALDPTIGADGKAKFVNDLFGSEAQYNDQIDKARSAMEKILANSEKARQAAAKQAHDSSPFKDFLTGADAMRVSLKSLQDGMHQIASVGGHAFEMLITGQKGWSAALKQGVREFFATEAEKAGGMAIEAGLLALYDLAIGNFAGATAAGTAAAGYAAFAAAYGVGSAIAGAPGGGSSSSGGGGAGNTTGQQTIGGSGGAGAGGITVNNHFNLGYGFIGDEKSLGRELDRVGRRAALSGAIPSGDPPGKRTS